MKKIIASILVTTLISCSSPGVKGVETGAVNCAEAQVSALATALLPSLAELLTGTMPNWRSSLNSILDSLGAAGACALQNAVKLAEAKMVGTGSNVAMAANMPETAIIKNGNAIIAARHLTFSSDSENPLK